jgi:hypothetical protein
LCGARRLRPLTSITHCRERNVVGSHLSIEHLRST